MKYTLKDLMPTDSQVQLVHPTMGELDVYLTLRGFYSDTVRQAVERAVEMSQDKSKSKSDIEKAMNEALALSIIGWSDDEFFGCSCTHEATVELMTNPLNNWLKKVVQDFLLDQRNFFRKPDSTGRKNSPVATGTK